MLQRIRTPVLFASIAALICLMSRQVSFQWVFLAVGLAMIPLALCLFNLDRTARLAETRALDLQLLQDNLATAQRETLVSKLASRQLSEKIEKLTSLCHDSQHLVDEVSHDLRTPLSVIKGYSEIMHEGMAGTLSDEQQRYSQLIIDRTRDLAQIVDDLLDMSKLRADALRADRSACDASAIVAALPPSLKARAAAAGVRWREDLAGALPPVFADPDKITRALSNLLLRAIKVSPENSHITLTAKLDPQGDIRLSVSDSGPALAPENLRTMLDVFHQAAPLPPNSKGPGLLLNVANELVRLNFGKMTASSNRDIGNTFSFILPMAFPPAIFAGLAAYLESKNTPSGSFAALSITPRGAAVPTNLRHFLASSSEPADLIFPTPDHSGLILCGYSLQPESWLHRLERLSQDLEKGNPRQKLPAFDAALIGVVPYPAPASVLLSLVESRIDLGSSSLPAVSPARPVQRVPAAVG